MSNIEFKDDSVCFAFNHQWRVGDKIGDGNGGVRSVDLDVLKSMVEKPDFQLNTIKQGDYIEASELDNKKYNDAVEVFELFGFKPYERDSKEALRLANEIFFVSDDLFFIGSSGCIGLAKRKLTYNQLMAIGELKRLEIKRDKNSAPNKMAQHLTPDLGIISSNKYERDITDSQGNSATVDVYDVLKAFDVTCPATQHALKKLLCSGLRGHKDLQTDLIEAKESITRAIELNE